MNRLHRLAQDTPRGRRVQHFADGGPVGYGAKGLAGLREMIPKVQAMGYPQAAPAPAADPRGVAGLKAMIPRVESMGYQQAGAAPPQYFAEGGLVKRLQQLVGMDPERNARIANYKAQSAAERLAGAPPPPTPAPAPAISGYSGMSAAQRREKEAGLKNGGHVRGPGTGTSDSIPARLSDGEFVLPADTVRKVGVRRLQDLVDDTHTPVKGGSKPGHFVNGGFTSSSTADDTLRQMQQQTEQRQREGQALGQAAAAEAQAQAEKIAQGMAANRAAAQPPAAAPPPTPAPAPSAPTAASAASAPAPVASTSSEFGGGGGGGGGGGAGGAAAPEPGGAVFGRYPSFAGTNLSSHATDNRLREGYTGEGAAARLAGAPEPAPAAGAGRGSVNPAFAVPDAQAGSGRGLINPPDVNPAAPSPPSSVPQPAQDVASTSNVSRVGNSYSGSNVAGDITVNGQAPRGGFMGTGDTFGSRSPVGMSVEAAQQAGLVGGRVGYNPAYDQRIGGNAGSSGPSGQNMAAADNLAARQSTGAAARLAGDSGPSTPSVNVPTTMHSGNSWQARNDLRNLEVSAKSITANGGPFDRNKGVSPERGAYAAAFNADLALKGGQDPVALAAMREAGDTQRAGMRERGEDARTRLMGSRLDATNQLESRRLGLQETAAGYQNRSADRLDRAQQDLERATTPEARTSARERLMGLAGKTDNEWRLQVTPTTKNADGSTTEGSVVRYNQRTGAAERVNVGQGGQPAAGQRAVGTVSTVNGKSATWDGQKWVPRA